MRKTLFKINSRGFTAVEIAMVASVIAILALLILPIFRQRAEEARVAAVEDELASLVKALLLVEADMPGGGYLVQLNDLDNRSNPTLDVLNDPLTPDLDPPVSFWNRDLGEFQFLNLTQVADRARYQTILSNWKGPYVAWKNTVSLLELRDRASLQPYTNQGANQGPISIPAPPVYNNFDLGADRYPVDPWGNPYLLFGPEETIYNVRVLYSVGPNGVPGNGNGDLPDYNRRNGVLGTGDDFSFTF